MKDKIYLRKKLRGGGKTTDLIELAEVLLELYKDAYVLLLFHHPSAVQYASKHFSTSPIFDKKAYVNRLIITSATKDAHFARGRTFNYMLIDEISLVSKECLQNIIPSIAHSKGTIYATDTLENSKPIFNTTII